ncbi:hypothetical protein [Paractinoplanes rishiriensis]|uniref:Uncharacterized protein n=1 Tax=Paractinoplanes rishiriensis TaxID=1050105 RepID=A0A919K204_9ACTN|nr:hypothetical protein [Actinoplanes rishiriensis]GIE99421.1 hypothetical protein Ari01nite_68860 [Actinoplanes rishiriensis]
MTVPAVVAGLCDDAAVFPPGLTPLPDAVRAYRDRQGTWYADLVGPLVLTAAALPELAPLLTADDPPLPVSVTLPDGPAGLPGVLAGASALPIELRSVEVAVPEGVAPGELADRLAGAGSLEVYVEVPRDHRRLPLIEAIAGRYRAKFRTGGVRADLHPGEAELAGAIAAVVAAGVPFKATAGLHHAVRNTDPVTGFEQHGFLNLLLATDSLAGGGSESDARALLAERRAATVAGLIGDLGEARVRRARSAFTSFGTCSITDPLKELVDMGVVAGGATS